MENKKTIQEALAEVQRAVNEKRTRIMEENWAAFSEANSPAVQAIINTARAGAAPAAAQVAKTGRAARRAAQQKPPATPPAAQGATPPAAPPAAQAPKPVAPPAAAAGAAQAATGTTAKITQRRGTKTPAAQAPKPVASPAAAAGAAPPAAPPAGSARRGLMARATPAVVGTAAVGAAGTAAYQAGRDNAATGTGATSTPPVYTPRAETPDEKAMGFGSKAPAAAPAGKVYTPRAETPDERAMNLNPTAKAPVPAADIEKTINKAANVGAPARLSGLGKPPASAAKPVPKPAAAPAPAAKPASAPAPAAKPAFVEPASSSEGGESASSFFAKDIERQKAGKIQGPSNPNRTKNEETMSNSPMIEAFLRLQAVKAGNIFEAAKKLSPKEKELAALGHPKDKITHKDVLIGRGVLSKEETLPPRTAVERVKDKLGLGPKSTFDSNSKQEPYSKEDRAEMDKKVKEVQKEEVEVIFSDAELAYFESVAPTPDDYSGSHNGPSKRDLTDETVLEGRKPTGNPRGVAAGSKRGSYKRKGETEGEKEEGAAETKSVAAQIRDAHSPKMDDKSFGGSGYIELKHPATDATHKIKTSHVDKFNRDYSSAEKASDKNAVERAFIDKHMGGGAAAKQTHRAVELEPDTIDKSTASTGMNRAKVTLPKLQSMGGSTNLAKLKAYSSKKEG